ncbi:hypothetical protein DdX_22296 [Ditylenchus destructor]|uniref:Uncharacterized protein n=1 Tax=Ditylenchus destructor TaxID=166010 RepID=A0AAD4MDR3_9BILA|nr:hypothetical protein DdX_22296 [Ditylenchus destructor]
MAIITFLLLCLYYIEARKCKGTGHYIDFNNNRHVSERAHDRKLTSCSRIPHNLSMDEDEDTPNNACQRKYCPSCILVLRKMCKPSTQFNRCHEFAVNPFTRDLCNDTGAYCDGLCYLIDKNKGKANKIVDKNRATPYKICQVLQLC